MPAPRFFGNRGIADSLFRMAAANRLPQTLLFAGPAGIGKATLARMLAAGINCDRGPARPCGECSACLRILAADLFRGEYRKQLEERAKLPAAKRSESPLIVSTHPDFLIFPPDGPLRMIQIEQARRLRQAARYNPSEGRRRVFVIDRADRANAEAANALLKTLEEPAPALTIILLAENPYELLPTIRSRAIPFYFAPLASDEIERFLATREEIPPEERGRAAAWSGGSPGRAVALDLEEFVRRREAMLTLLQTALGAVEFARLAGEMQSFTRGGGGSLDLSAEMLYSLLRDLLRIKLGAGGGLTHADIRADLEPLAERATFEWVERARAQTADLEKLQRRNIQKQMALEALALDLRTSA